MPFFNSIDLKTNHIPILFIVLSMTLIFSCSQRHISLSEKNVSTVYEKTDFGFCTTVHGHILGDIIPGSEVFLFELDNRSYPTVMNTVRMNTPVQIGVVNHTAGFNFSCLDIGNYVVSIPAGSYRNESVGSPMPSEIIGENVSLEIYFQGGDTEYLVGTFGIWQTNKAPS